MFGTEFRRRWRSWLILVILIAVVGGLVLAAAAAGRRTATAFPRFVAAHGYDSVVFTLRPLPGLAKLPDVASVTIAGEPFNGNVTCACKAGINSGDLSVNDLSPAGLARVTKLIAGRMPLQSSPDQVLASFNLEQDYGVHIGTVIHTPFYTPAQEQSLLGGANVAPAGPTIAFHVVGIEAAETEFPTGQVSNYNLYPTQAFARTVGRRVGSGMQYLVRLRHGEADLSRFGAEMSSMHVLQAEPTDPLAAEVTSSIHPQAVGWWVLAVLAALAALAVIGQALGRQSAVEGEQYPTLAALGIRRYQLVAIGTTRNLVVATIGAVGAVLVAFALSPLTPVGEARLAEPSTGLAFDPLVLLLGALTIVVVVLLLGIWPAIRASRTRIGDDRAPDTPSPIVTRLAGTGAPPSIVIGVRHAVERGRGTATVPVGSALFGTVLAVLALCATAVFGASLSHLTATPKLYGEDYQLFFSEGGQLGIPESAVTHLKHDREITGIMVGTRNEVTINAVSVYTVAGSAVRGPLLLSRIEGQLPAGNGQIMMGATTLRQVHARVGSAVTVAVPLPGGGTRTAMFRVVGTGSFPGQFGLGGLGTGAAFTMDAYLNVVCPAGPHQRSCQQAYYANQEFAVFATAASGVRGQDEITHFINAFPGVASRPAISSSLVNFGEAVNFPLILGLMLALFGTATLVHLLVVSVVRRRHEIGLLKALGFVNRQVGAAVCWQATTVALVGIVVGVPLGVAIGGVVWRAFASNLGAVPVSTVPVWLIAALGGGVLVVANLLALAPAWVAARSKTSGQLLRTQ